MDVSKYDPAYSFQITGATYIVDPKPNSVMFVGKKIGELITNLERAANCLVFVEEGVDVLDEYREQNCIVLTDNPSHEYAEAAKLIWKERQQYNKNRQYRMSKEGFWCGENVSFGKNVYIQPGVFIDHDVVIGDDVMILSGAKVSNVRIGDNCIIKQNAVVGGYGFTMARNTNNEISRIPSLGNVVLHDEVEVGSFTTICCGTGNDTILQERVKLDDHVHIGHDVNISHDTEITAGVIVGGFCKIGSNCFIGINASLRNRISIGNDVFVGMGAVVVKSFGDGVTVIGNPARIKEKN